MTPNKLPSLPELPQGVKVPTGNIHPLADQWVIVYGGDEMKAYAIAYAAEALRQSQSLPAGAVAGLVGKWRDSSAFETDGYSILHRCADDLTAALQADAREKGEDANRYNWLKCGGWEVMQDPRMWPAGLRFDAAIDAGMAMAAAGGHATQPAQASEAAGPVEYQNLADAAEWSRCLDRAQAFMPQARDAWARFSNRPWNKQAMLRVLAEFAAAIATSSQETASE